MRIEYRIGDFLISWDYKSHNSGTPKGTYIFVTHIKEFTNNKIVGSVYGVIENPDSNRVNMGNYIKRYGTLTIYKDGTKHLKWDEQ